MRKAERTFHQVWDILRRVDPSQIELVEQGRKYHIIFESDKAEGKRFRMDISSLGRKLWTELCLHVHRRFGKRVRFVATLPTEFNTEGFPRCWNLFRFVLPSKVRVQIYEPYNEELKADYLLARRYRGKWARRWITFAFTVRTAHLWFTSLRVAFFGWAWRLIKLVVAWQVIKTFIPKG